MPSGPCWVVESIVDDSGVPPPEPSPAPSHFSEPPLATSALSDFAETVLKYVLSATSLKLPTSLPARDLPALPVQPAGTPTRLAPPAPLSFSETLPEAADVGLDAGGPEVARHLDGGALREGA